jgi:hypothetical protein
MTNPNPSPELRAAVEKLTRPIIGMENRTPLEVRDILFDRIRSHFAALSQTLPAPGEVERYERERLAIARALGERFIARGNARVTGSSYKSYDEMPYSYTVDFLVDAEAVLEVFTPTLATVAEGEALREYYEAAEAVMPGGMTVTDDMWRRYVNARAAIRLLSQGEGK